MIVLHGSGPRRSTQREDLAPKNTAFVPQAQVTQASDGDDDESEVAHIKRPYQPNPKSYCCIRAKKMRLMSAIYMPPAAAKSATEH